MTNRRVWISDSLSEGQARLKDELSGNLVSREAAAELRGYLEECFRPS